MRSTAIWCATRRIAYTIAIVAFTTIALAPSILLLPQRSTEVYRIALLVLVIAFLLYRSLAGPTVRKIILVWVAAGAGVTIATIAAVRALPPEAQLRLPAPNVLASWLGADGELADDTFFYEIFNEIWLCVAFAIIAIWLVWTRMAWQGR